jgi:hypothetical protein
LASPVVVAVGPTAAAGAVVVVAPGAAMGLRLRWRWLLLWRKPPRLLRPPLRLLVAMGWRRRSLGATLLPRLRCPLALRGWLPHKGSVTAAEPP